MTARFKDQVVVITGAARGMGFAAASLFAQEGARVAINDLDPAAVDAAVTKISATGGQAIGLPGDVSDQAQVGRNVQQVLDHFGRIDVLVNNAGIISRSASATIDAKSWHRVIAVNLDGVFFWSQAVAAAAMIPQRSGAIVNVASVAGMTGIPNSAAYVASKHAVVGLTRALAVDWGQYDIRVNAVCPGITRTELSAADRARSPEVYAAREGRIPLGRPAEADDQARAILFLASADAASVTGLVMNVDGGSMALASFHTPPRDGA
jgi:NAD(P)-dependent dehydrogenase (short-subunit alcohol dehydrogenase family)